MEKYRTHVVYNVQSDVLEYFRSIPEKYAVLSFAAASGTLYNYRCLSVHSEEKDADNAANRHFWNGGHRVTVWKKENGKVTNENGHEIKGLSIEKIR